MTFVEPIEHVCFEKRKYINIDAMQREGINLKRTKY